jgi:formate-dependent nitrite reductase membrane component NrfD
MVDVTMHHILSRLLLLIVVALGLCLALLLLRALVGKVPKVATTKTLANVAGPLTCMVLLLGLVVGVGSLLKQEIGARLMLLLLLYGRLVWPYTLIWHLLWWPLLLILPSMVEHRADGRRVEARPVVTARRLTLQTALALFSQVLTFLLHDERSVHQLLETGVLIG